MFSCELLIKITLMGVKLYVPDEPLRRRSKEANSPSLPTKDLLLMENTTSTKVSPCGSSYQSCSAFSIYGFTVDTTICPLLRSGFTCNVLATYSSSLGSTNSHCIATIGSMLFIVSGMVTMLSAMPLALPTCSSFTENGSAMMVTCCLPLGSLEITVSERDIAPRLTGAYSNGTYAVEYGSIIRVVCCGMISESSTTISLITSGILPLFHSSNVCVWIERIGI